MFYPKWKYTRVRWAFKGNFKSDEYMIEFI